MKTIIDVSVNTWTLEHDLKQTAAGKGFNVSNSRRQFMIIFNFADTLDSLQCSRIAPLELRSWLSSKLWERNQTFRGDIKQKQYYIPQLNSISEKFFGLMCVTHVSPIIHEGNVQYELQFAMEKTRSL